MSGHGNTVSATGLLKPYSPVWLGLSATAQCEFVTSPGSVLGLLNIADMILTFSHHMDTDHGISKSIFCSESSVKPGNKLSSFCFAVCLPSIAVSYHYNLRHLQCYFWRFHLIYLRWIYTSFWYCGFVYCNCSCELLTDCYEFDAGGYLA